MTNQENKECEHKWEKPHKVVWQCIKCRKMQNFPPNQENNWEIEWDKKFFKFHEVGAIENSDEMKPFIRQLLQDERQRIVEEIEEMKIKVIYDGDSSYNQALQEIIDKLKK